MRRAPPCRVIACTTRRLLNPGEPQPARARAVATGFSLGVRTAAAASGGPISAMKKPLDEKDLERKMKEQKAKEKEEKKLKAKQMKTGIPIHDEREWAGYLLDNVI
ncbi:hypothetical protein PR202_gb07140 [Eleusine coracana subsp. coracana]|uniref:Uncharacterized protein n=1 Tax=Eleusine coracana subsp. coracana TaxID=191504 RepID=A0AAV5EBI4_ELECO|nr:hypothetical protein PR202_gb07140 [Eleusine coracana subsp. coracana]